MDADGDNNILLPHHKQQTLCTTRLPYRQGRTLTAVKVYTVAKESNHLLIFGVPSLNLRQEIKTHFLRFGKLLQFNISKSHSAEQFTETYHAQFERVHSARIAKKMLDTKNLYGGILHVCYAPEFETIEETNLKLVQRQKDVTNRLRNLQKEAQSEVLEKQCDIQNVNVPQPIAVSHKLNMGEVNVLKIGDGHKDKVCVVNKKRKMNCNVIEKKFKPCYREVDDSKELNNIDVVDCTQVDREVITNVNDHLNYNKFGNEVIRKVLQKPVNRIVFNINKKS